jgi:membrane-associated phospholipid phosphatase
LIEKNEAQQKPHSKEYWIRKIIRLFTLTGNVFPQFLLISALIAFVDVYIGLKLALVWAMGYGLNLILKNTIKKSRPPKEHAKVHVKGYSLPSGHAFMSTVTYLGICLFFDFNIAAKIALATVPFLLGLSRLYLKVHDIYDICAGWGFGILYLYIFLQVI